MSSNRSIISQAVSWSRLPVGSSAINSGGWATTARADKKGELPREQLEVNVIERDTRSINPRHAGKLDDWAHLSVCGNGESKLILLEFAAGRSGDPDQDVSHYVSQRPDELGTRVEGRRPADAKALLAGERLRLDVQVEQDLEVVGDEADRAN